MSIPISEEMLLMGIENPLISTRPRLTDSRCRQTFLSIDSVSGAETFVFIDEPSFSFAQKLVWKPFSRLCQKGLSKRKGENGKLRLAKPISFGASSEPRKRVTILLMDSKDSLSISHRNGPTVSIRPTIWSRRGVLLSGITKGECTNQ